MYINHNKIVKLELAPWQVLLMSAAKQNKGDLANEITYYLQDDEIYEKMLENGLLKLIKGKKGQSDFEKLRLDKKGKKLLEDLEDATEVLEQDKLIGEWLKKLYLENDKQIGNYKKTLRHLAAFRNHTGLEKNRLAHICRDFIENDDEMEFSHVLEYVLYKAPNPYATRFNLENSRLHKYYLKHEEKFKKDFKRLNI